MAKRLFSTLALGTTVVAAGAALIFYKHKLDGKAAIEQVTEKIGSDKEVISSWVEPTYQRVDINDSNKLCIVGGINIMENFEIVQYHFLVDAFTGEILNLKKTN